MYPSTDTYTLNEEIDWAERRKGRRENEGREGWEDRWRRKTRKIDRTEEGRV